MVSQVTGPHTQGKVPVKDTECSSNQHGGGISHHPAPLVGHPVYLFSKGLPRCGDAPLLPESLKTIYQYVPKQLEETLLPRALREAEI